MLMYQYIAFVWRDDDPNRHRIVQNMEESLYAQRVKWTLVFRQSGIAVYHSGSLDGRTDAIVLPEASGVILGTLFSQQTNNGKFRDQRQIGDREAATILRTAGRALIEQYWGRYVAFLRNPSKWTYIIRDPSSAIPCFSTSHKGVEIYFSWTETIARVADINFSVNWSYVTAYLLHSTVRNGNTGLNEISEVLAGQCVKTNGESSHSEFYWDPRTIATSKKIENTPEAVKELRQTTMRCVASWGSRFQNIIQELSGGLDSAIVLGCLTQMRMPLTVICLNLVMEDVAGDERRFARAAARRAGCELIERRVLHTDNDLDDLLTTPLLPNPSWYTMASGIDKIFRDLAAETAADAYFSGQGGDHLFHQNKTELIAADYARAHPINPELFIVAHNVARLTGNSFWSVMQTALISGYLRRTPNPLTSKLNESSALCYAALRDIDIEYIAHPWQRDPLRCSPAKFSQISSLVDFQTSYWRNGRAEVVDIVYPLFSQPIIETCLRTPTYILTAGGVDRSTARQAFTVEVPKEIISRYTKGSATNYYNSILSNSISVFRTLLLDGWLTAEGILDRNAIENSLSDRNVLRGDSLFSLSQYISAEIWLRNWLTVHNRAAP